MTPNLQVSGSTALAILSTILLIVTTIFWMIVGWRAMRAHERIADSLERK